MTHFYTPSRFTLLVLALICLAPNLIGQNIAPNPSFEVYTNCPVTFGQGGPLPATPWESATQGTSDYFHECGAPVVDVPANFFGNEPAHTGVAYAGGYYRYNEFVYREYLLAPLLDTMVADTYYYVSWWTSLGDNTCGVDQLGAYFSVDPPPSGGFGPIDVNPQIVANLGFVSETNGWTLIEGCFMASGGELYITIGNFSEEEDTPIDSNCTFFGNTSYYYVDDITVEAGPPPGTIDFDLGGPFEACYTYDVEAPIPDAIYTWSDGSHGQILTVTESGIYTLTISDGCSTGTDDVEVTILGSPAVEIGPAEAMLCEGDSYDISLDPDAGTYEWQDGSTDSDYSINTSGLYSVTLDDGCHESTDEVLIEIVDFPDPFDLGEDTYVCDGDEIEYNFDPELGDFLWQDNSTSSDYVITEPGTYSLTISNVCGESTDEIHIELIEEPDFTLGPEQLFMCEGDIYEIELDEEMGDFIWNDGSTESFYSITVPGLYAVTVSNECGSLTQNIEVFFYVLPEPDLGDDLVVCPAQLPVTLQASGSPGDSFLWQDGSEGDQFVVTDAGIYSVTVSNGCASVSDQVVVLVEDAAPQVVLPADQLLCDGETITLSADFIIGDYEWQDGSIELEYVVTSPGTYTLTVTNECGSDADTVVIDYIPGVSPPDLGPDVILCPAQLPIVLDAGNDPNITYEWQDGSGTSEFTVTEAGFYSVTVSNGCDEQSDIIELVVEYAIPNVVLPFDQLLCQGQTFTMTAGNLVGQYEWQDGSTGTEFVVTSPGTYTLTVTNVCGSDADTAVVNYIPAIVPPNLGFDVTLCPGEEYVFYATTPGLNYTWQDGSHADSLVVSGAGTYWLNVADMCSDATDSVNVTIGTNPPVVDLPTSLPLCNNAFVTVDAGISGVNYLWNDGSQGPSIIVGSPGSYSITVSNACGSDVDTVNVIDAGPAPFVDLGNDIDICNGDVVSLSPVFSNVNTWLWSDGSTGQTFNVTQTGIVSVEVTNNCGDFSDAITVSLLPDVPPIDLGADTSLCPGESFDLSINASGVNILWSNGSTQPDLNVSAPGLVYATITNSCGSASDSVTVTALPPIPPLDLGIDQSLCPGEVITIAPGIANVEYLWHDGSTGTTFNTTSAGQIILTISNDCGAATDTIIITENNNAPQVNLGADILACEGDVVSLSSDISGVNYLWQDGSTLPDFSTTSSGTFTLQVSNACGQDKDTVVVNINGSVPTPDLGPDVTLCDGATLQLISTADAITSVEWQDGSSQPVFNVTSPGEYILAESNHCGDISDTISIDYLSPPPAVDLGPDKTLCPGESVTLAAPTTTATITWQDGSHGPTFIANQSQIYSLQLSNDCGTTTDDFELTIDSRSPFVNLADEYPWCPESVFSLDVTQPFAAEYLWNDGSALPTIQISEPGVYSVMVLTDCKTVDHELEVFESDTCIRKDDFYVPNVFTPNNDERNDYFEVFTGPELDVTSVKCSIYDRWGNLVYFTNTEPIRWDGSFHNKVMNQAVFTYLIHIKYLDRGIEKTHIIPGEVTLVR